MAHNKCINPGVIFGPFGGNCGPLWIILGHSRAMLDHFGPFGVIFRPLWVIFGQFCGIFGQICGKLNFFCGPVGVAGFAFRMYALTKKQSSGQLQAVKANSKTGMECEVMLYVTPAPPSRRQLLHHGELRKVASQLPMQARVSCLYKT